MENNEKEVVKTVETTPAKEVETKTGAVEFTPEQQKKLDELLDKQFARLKTQEEKRIKELEQAEKLKSMSEVERAQAELKLLQDKLKDYENEKLRDQFKVELTTKGLKADFAEIIPVNDAEHAKKAVDFLNDYKTEIEKQYTDKIKDLEEQVRNLTLRGSVPNAPKDAKQVAKSTPTNF